MTGTRTRMMLLGAMPLMPGGISPAGGTPAVRTGDKAGESHAVSKNPGDTTAWKVRDKVDPFGTRSQFVKVDGGDE